MATMKQHRASLTREIEAEKARETASPSTRPVQPTQSTCRRCGGPSATGSSLCGEC